MATILLLGCLLSPTMVAAQEAPATASTSTGPSISLRPGDLPDGSRFEIELEPGDSHEFTVVIGNFGADPIELRTYVTDIVPSLNGGLLMADPDEEKTGSALWIDYASEEFTVQPGELVALVGLLLRAGHRASRRPEKAHREAAGKKLR